MRFPWNQILLLLLVCVIQTAWARTVSISTEDGLFASLQAKDVDEIQLEGNIVLQAWSSVVVLDHNVTITASASCARPPVLNINYLSSRLQLGIGVHFTINGVYVFGHTFPGAPGFCLLASAPLTPDSWARPRVTLKDAGAIFSTCIPFDMVRAYAHVAPC